MSDKLSDAIVSLSEADTYGYAYLEWDLAGLKYGWTHCACGHSIREACHMKNRLNGNIIIVGNCCISAFGHKGDTLLALRALHDERLNEALIDLVYKHGVINKKERSFLDDVWRKRVFTYKQRRWYTSLKTRIFRAFGRDEYADHLLRSL